MKSAYGLKIPEPDPTLTRVGSGTPCGELMRRYWQPVCLSDDLKDLPKAVTLRAQDIAMKATAALGTRDYARVDMRLNKKGELFILEVNPNPNLSEGTGIDRSAEAAKIKFSQLLGNIVESALSRRKAPLGD